MRLTAVLLLAVSLASPAGAVIILDSTWAAEGGKPGAEAAGFGAHIALANEPQFDALISFSSDGDTWGECSGTWIGNDAQKDVAYVLTAAHCFEASTKATMYAYRTQGGTVLTGIDTVIHPDWNGSFDARTGYDLAIVRLKGRVTDGGPQPAIYAGRHEKNRVLTFVGFGDRGTGSSGDDDAYYDASSQREEKAAAQGRIDQLVEAVTPLPKGRKKDSGNYLGVFLPKEDASIPNPYGGPATPVSRLAGLLGSGDSGGSAWLQLGDGRWAIAGVNSNGSGDANYGDTSWFVRVSTNAEWIASVFPDAILVAD